MVEITETINNEEQDIHYKFYINNTEKNNKEYKYKNNTISTTKYNIITFIPKSLFYQFQRLANVYFLVTAILSCFKIITPVASSMALIPIIFVLLVSLVRELIEDINRYKLDKEQNNEKTEFLQSNEFKVTESGKLEMGQIIKVKKNEIFPSDMILIDSSLNEGLCYIETASLDGEKSLKIKQANILTVKFLEKNNFNISGFCITDKPNPLLYHLQGKMQIYSDNKNYIEIPLDVKQLLLKGAKLKNTEYIYGIVLYTGNNNKIMLNSKKPRMKYSTLEKLMNKLLIIIFCFQILLCIFCAIMHKVYFDKNLKNNPFLKKMDVSNIHLDSFISFFSYILLIQTMIPISLIVTLEIVKTIQALFIYADLGGYSKIRNKFILPHNINLNEECGMVDYIFSDKTGTLTCNKMQFRYSIINGQLFSEKNIDEHILENDIKLNYWKGLALCHNCNIDDNDNYIGLSPDNIELLNASKKSGIEFIKNPENKMSIRRIKILNLNFYDIELLDLFEFTSERKRESVIIRDTHDNNKIKLYTKGADNIISERLSENTDKEILNKTQYYVDKYSSLGYRTLFISMKILSEEEYEIIKNKLNNLRMSLNKNKDIQIENYLSKEVEINLNLLGATIVEDKLQDEVNETIASLQLSNIKIWMLTGDKMSTAYNIALSCNLLSKSEVNKMKIFSIEGKMPERDDKLSIINKEETEEVIINFSKEFEKYKEEKSINALNQKSQKFPIYNFGILIDSLALITLFNNEELQHIFINIAQYARSVICCRVTPLQKSQIVKMVKNYLKNKITLAIGDGGNDVSMIMEAHIGIGIFGEEGMNAVQSSDYAIGEFKILKRLLLYHGRNNYMKISMMILFFFYKNFILTIDHFFFSFYSNFSAQTTIDDWLIGLYNLLLTAFPLGTRACYDWDICDNDGKIIHKFLPKLYLEQKDIFIPFTLTKFLLYILKAIIHALLNFFFTIYALNNIPVNIKGDQPGLWFISVVLYTNIVIIVTNQLIINTSTHTYIHWLIIGIITYLAYIIVLITLHFDFKFGLDKIFVYHSQATYEVVVTSAHFWLLAFLICGFCFVIDLLIKTYHINMGNPIIGRLQILLKNVNYKLDELEQIDSDELKNIVLEYDNFYKEKKEDNHLNNVPLSLKDESVEEERIDSKKRKNSYNKGLKNEELSSSINSKHSFQNNLNKKIKVKK